MRLSAPGAIFITNHEGLVMKWYLDPVGIPTIGIGFTWRSASFRKWWLARHDGRKMKRGDTISRSEAEQVLQMLVDEQYGRAVNAVIQPTQQHIYDGASSVAYNLGEGSLKWKWGVALAAGRIKEAARRLRTTGVTARGKKLNGLVRRRKEESRLIEFAEYGIGKHPTFAPVNRKTSKKDETLLNYQKMLKTLGYYKGKLDGLNGPRTTAAVKVFQIDHPDLENDGILGRATMAQLQRRMDLRKKGVAASVAPIVTAGAELAVEPSQALWWVDYALLGASFVGLAAVVYVAVRYWPEIEQKLEKL